MIISKKVGVGVQLKDALDAAFYSEDLHKKYKWSNKVWDAIHKQKIYVGMTTEQVKLSWGSPKKINKTATSKVTYEQWVFENGDYLYF